MTATAVHGAGSPRRDHRLRGDESPPTRTRYRTKPPLTRAVRTFPTGIEGINGPTNDFNREELRMVEMPAGNGMGDAGSIAKLYGSAATGGSEIGLSPTTLDALKGLRYRRRRDCATRCYTSTRSSPLASASPAR
jgi:hypothetical protein